MRECLDKISLRARLPACSRSQNRWSPRQFRAARRLLCGVAMLGATGAPHAASSQPQSQPPAMMRDLTACRAVTADAERLACFDKAAATIDQAATRGEVIMIDREQAQVAKRQAFGLSLPKLPSLFSGDAATATVDAVTGVIASARQDASGAWTVRLEDGQVWSQIDSGANFRDPKPGMPVRIRKASLGSFLMVIDGQGGIRARRLQ